MDSKIKILKPAISASADYILEALRGVTEDAHNKQILHLDVSYKVLGDPQLKGFIIGQAPSKDI